MGDMARIMKDNFYYRHRQQHHHHHLRYPFIPGCLILSISLVVSLSTTVDTQPTSSSSTTSFEQQRRYQLSPQQQGLKPAGALEELPPPDLIEPSPRPDDPRTAELNATVLRLKLGPNYDPTFMSVVLPKTSDDDSNGGAGANFGFRRNRLGRLIPTGVMPDYLSKMDFKYVTLTNGSKLRTKITSKLKRKIQQFLWAYTACSVVYHWKDLGIRFWPRYLKEGYCPQDVSCSIPPGMSCTPSDSTHKTILRWHCKSSGSGNIYGTNHPIYHAVNGLGGTASTATAGLGHHSNNRHCQWIKVEYPILTECSCACPRGSANKF